MKTELNDKWSLISKKLAGETNPSEDDLFNDWIQGKENKALYQTILRIKLGYDPEAALERKEDVFEKTFDKIFTRPPGKRTNRFYFLLSIAASIALLIGCFSFYIIFHIDKNDQSLVVFTSSNGISRITLPDSTLVTLNIGSSLSYTPGFNKEDRQVQLTGEAFFDVKRNKQKPFIVKTEKIEVKVLGTVFNIKCDAVNHLITTSLISGNVMVNETDGKGMVELLPGEESIYNSQTGKMNVGNFNTNQVINWTFDPLTFQKDSFGAVCDILEERFNCTIEIQKTDIGTKLFTGKFKNNESIIEILEIIKINIPFSYEIKENTIIIY